jgi:ClpP class serine protease
MINFDVYVVKKPDRNRIAVIKPSLPSEHTPKSMRKFADELEQYEKAKEVNLKEWKKYEKQVNEMHDKFKEDVIKDLGIKDDPKADTYFYYIWHKYKDDGLQEVYAELAYLIEEIV